ncbi:Eukaryotic translation initiation factor 4 gamma 1 [Heterocephalus glaber]|uniref:Eukaryotic translation initiation factor 4 gamma 1 n=1 Tax=Heterocephalus glaber TaxID=10181 RepID=G5BWT8_HETGA|nr:Eukaryotic translation initiation factor 4 gamma 1 [Heterocephalus glaber]
MMIPSQISYSASQGAYHIPGQGRSTYVVPTQQYPVQPGTPSFYPDASPVEFGTCTGAYYPAQGAQQFPAGVAPAPVLMNQPPQIGPKRERKTIQIRDRNQGGKDIPEEIKSGALTASTPIPPQTGGGLEPQANGETPQVAVIVQPDDWTQGALTGSRPGLPGPEDSPSESQPSSPSPTPSPPPILEPGSELNLGVLSLPGDTMPTGMIQIAQSLRAPALAPRPEEAEETWDSKENKIQNAENIHPGKQKYNYKSDQWKPLNLEEKKRYDQEFLLGFQFIFASMQKPEGLPYITDVVLDKPNKTPLQPLDPSRLPGINCGPDFTPSFANLGRPALSICGPLRGGPVLMTEDIKLNKTEKAWKPSSKRIAADKEQEEDADGTKTQDLLRRVRCILNKLTPQMFQQLMKQVTQLAIDTEECLKGVIDLIFEKAISEPNFSVAYANMCRCLMALKVSTTEKPTVTVNFQKLLLNRCQKEFEKDKDDDEVFEKKQKEMDEAATAEEQGHLKEELEEARDRARRRSLGNIKFIGELFKLKMLTEAIMHDCVVKLLKNHYEESLECLCRLLTTIDKDLEFAKAKPRMDPYFNQDVLDLRQSNWVPCRGDQGPKTIDQIHKEAKMQEHREHIKVQQLMAKGSDKHRGGPPGPPISRGLPLVDDGSWNTVPISKGSCPIDTSRLTKITNPGSIDSKNQLFAPGGRLSWGKGSSGGSGAKLSDAASEPARPATSNLNRFSALQQAVPMESTDNRRVVQRSSLSRERSEKKYLCDEQELQALYALQALVVTLEQPPNLLWMFFDALYDEDMVKEKAFYSWKSSKDPAEQLGKGVALKFVTAFFNWLWEAEEEESDHN